MPMPVSRFPGALIALFAAALLAMGGCASQKEPAEQALAAIDKTMSESGAQIEKYFPDRYQEINGRVAKLREALANGDYGDVVTDAASVTDDLKRAVADARIEGGKAKARMQQEWAKMIETVPAMIEAVDKKLARQGSRLPQGMDRAAFRAMVDSYDAARESWGKAAEGMTRANFEATVEAGRQAQATIAGVMKSLGLPAS